MIFHSFAQNPVAVKNLLKIEYSFYQNKVVIWQQSRKKNLIFLNIWIKTKFFLVRFWHFFTQLFNNEFLIYLFQLANWEKTLFWNWAKGMSCESACANAHVRCAVAQSILESVRDVRACGPFLDVRRACVCLENGSRTRVSYPVLEHPFLLWNILSCFGSLILF